MNGNVWRRVGAGVAGIAVGAGLSLATDAALESAGVLPRGNLHVSAGLVWTVLLYRAAYNALGCHVAARLTPGHPMRMALVLGAIGTAVSVAGALATASLDLGPAWYAWTLAALTLPSAWLGGALAPARGAGERAEA